MAKRKPNRHVGRTLTEFVRDQRTKDARFAEEWDNLQLARRIRTLRVARKLTQAELARRVSTTQSAIARLESGEVTPTLPLLQRIASVMGLRLTVGFARADREAELTPG